MKIGIFSDSHDNLTNIRKALSIFSQSKIEVLIHAGDFCSPFVFAEFKVVKAVFSQMYAVFGNNDGDKLMLTKKGQDFCLFKEPLHIVEIGGKKILITHYPELAEQIYKTGDYDLVIFGHNHQQKIAGQEKLLLNPGTCAGYVTNKASIAIVDLETMKAEFIAI